MKKETRNLIIAVVSTLVIAAALQGLTEVMEDKLPANTPELSRVSYDRNDSTGFALVQVHRPELSMIRVFLYDSTGSELLDFVDDWNGKLYIGTVKDSDSTRTAIPPERVREIWDSIDSTFNRGKPFGFSP